MELQHNISDIYIQIEQHLRNLAIVKRNWEKLTKLEKSEKGSKTKKQDVNNLLKLKNARHVHLLAV